MKARKRSGDIPGAYLHFASGGNAPPVGTKERLSGCIRPQPSSADHFLFRRAIMLQWLQDHNQAFNTVANLGMLLVWVAYLQLFLQNFRRQRRAHILINRGAGRDLNARCLIGNMSSEAIYIESIIAKLHDGQEVIGCAITDFVRQDGGAQSDDRRFGTRQGPLSAGDYIDVGSFRSILDQVARNAEREFKVPDHSFGVEVLIIVDYASENLVVGAKRRFEVESQRDRVLLNACSAGTEQIRSRRERRQLEAMKQEYL